MDREDDLLEEELDEGEVGYQRAGMATRVPPANRQLVCSLHLFFKSMTVPYWPLSSEFTLL